MNARILHHGRCFDGAVSAALMIRLLSDRSPEITSIDTLGLIHGHGSPYGPDSFPAEVNCVVDFRYSASPRLTWWFDHHETTFESEAEERHFAADRSGRRFFDPQAPSCAGLIHRIARREFGCDLTPRDPEWIHWADLIDAARFPTPEMAVALTEPALQLMTWLEAASTPTDEARLVREIAAGARLDQLPTTPFVAAGLTPALEEHHRTTALVRSRMQVDRGVALVDLLDVELPGINKFITYAANPEVIYTVMAISMPGKTKISVGSNPWAQDLRRHDLSRLCQRHGGGGHPAVGAVSLPQGEVEQARSLSKSIALELKS